MKGLSWERILKTILFTSLVVLFGLQSFADPLVSIQVEATEDRWIHFPDGFKLRHGMEITHLLNQSLYENGSFRVELPQSNYVGIGLSSVVNDSEMKELAQRLPNQKLTYIDSKQAQNGIAANSAQIIVRPKVHTLLYASGKRSNRVVYGFSPDRLNPYNMGIDNVSKDNDFTAAQFSEVRQCSNLDFFNGQLKTRGWAHKRGNFGADADEGFSFEIFGFGVSFRQKKYSVKLGIEFDVHIPSKGFRKTYDYEFKASGKDLSIGASYAGIHLGFETQRRKTMRNAIEESLPKILEQLIADLPSYIWTAKLDQLWDGRWIIPAGVFEGIEEGQVFEAANGNRYVVTDAMETVSVVHYLISNPQAPSTGEELRFVEDLRLSPWGQGIGIQKALANEAVGFNTKIMSASSTESGILKTMSGELEQSTAPEYVASNIGNCAEKKHSWFEKLVMAIMTFYAQWRFENVYDQEFTAQNQIKTAAVAPRVALIGSGVFPREKGIEQFIDNTGFDFISWDNRPSDDQGSGTAAAKLLVNETNKDFLIVPVKVFGPYGQTHSSAVYSAMDWVSKRQDIDLVVVPWVPAVESSAYKEGIQKIIDSGKQVVVPEKAKIQGAVLASASSKKYKTKGIRSAKIQLAEEGAGVIQTAAKIINKGL